MNTTTIILPKTKVAYLVNFLFLLTMATGAPLLGFHSQWITGPLVNMALILSVFTVGTEGALLLGILPSTIALGTGLLPPVLAPMIPFIIISNTILVLVINFINKNALNKQCFVSTGQYFSGLIIAAGLKFLFLFFTSGLVISLLLKKEVAVKVAQMMSWPQFFTAIIGGILAWGVLRFKFYKNEN